MILFSAHSTSPRPDPQNFLKSSHGPPSFSNSYGTGCSTCRNPVIAKIGYLFQNLWIQQWLLLVFFLQFELNAHVSIDVVVIFSQTISYLSKILWDPQALKVLKGPWYLSQSGNWLYTIGKKTEVEWFVYNLVEESITFVQKLQQALKSWSNFCLVLFGKGQKIHRTTLTNPVTT